MQRHAESLGAFLYVYVASNHFHGQCVCHASGGFSHSSSDGVIHCCLHNLSAIHISGCTGTVDQEDRPHGIPNIAVCIRNNVKSICFGVSIQVVSLDWRIIFSCAYSNALLIVHSVQVCSKMKIFGMGHRVLVPTKPNPYPLSGQSSNCQPSPRSNQPAGT